MTSTEDSSFAKGEERREKSEWRKVNGRYNAAFEYNPKPNNEWAALEGNWVLEEMQKKE